MKKKITNAINVINLIAYQYGFRVSEISMPDFLKESLINENVNLKKCKKSLEIKYFDVFADEFGIIVLRKSKNINFKLVKDKK